MAEDDLLICPLCEGRSRIGRAKLADLAAARNLQQKVESCLGGAAAHESAFVAADQAPARDFQKEVHSWNPQLPIWRRSPKE